MQNKKLLFLMIFGLSISVSVFSQIPFQQLPQREVSNPKADKNWEFVKNRLFNGETNIVRKYNSDILIRLAGNPNKEDSTIVSDLISQLKNTISVIDARYTKTGGNLVLTIENAPDFLRNETKSRASGVGIGYKNFNYYVRKHPDEFQASYVARMDTMVNDFSEVTLLFNDSVSFFARKKLIEYEVIQLLCEVRMKYYDSQPFSKGAILEKPYSLADPLETEFTSVDKFLLSKLYDFDFQKQFKEYVIKSSSWRYYMNFAHKAYMRTIGISTTLILALIILLATYKPIFRHKFKKDFLNYFIRGVVVAVSIYLLQYIYSFFTISRSGINLEFVIKSIVLFPAIISLSISTPLYLVERILLRPKMSRYVQLVIKIILILTVILLLSFIGNQLAVYWPRQFFDFFALGIILSVGRGTLMFIDYSEELRALAKDTEISKLKELKAKAEVQSLHSRINPHFLYNSLNSIAGLAHSNPDKTEKMALSLSDLFRYSINRKDEQMSSIREEVEIVRSYLEIEQIRFGDRLSFKFEVDKNLEILQIPRFIIQPLVENAIKHGISNIEGKGEITISVQKNEDAIVITVGDNGPAFPDGLVSGYGLQSLYDLLNLTYGEKAGVNWQNMPDKFIRVTIPIEL